MCYPAYVIFWHVHHTLVNLMVRTESHFARQRVAAGRAMQRAVCKPPLPERARPLCVAQCPLYVAQSEVGLRPVKPAHGCHIGPARLQVARLWCRATEAKFGPKRGIRI
jgi:hypothetical protein